MEPKYLNININRNQIKTSTSRAYLIAMPHSSDYDGFTFWFPMSLVDEGRHDEALRLCIPVSFDFKLRRTSPKTRQVLAEEGLNAYQLVEQFRQTDENITEKQKHEPEQLAKYPDGHDEKITVSRIKTGEGNKALDGVEKGIIEL